MVLGALAEGFGLLMIVPIATIAIDGTGGALSRFTPWLRSLTGDGRLLASIALFVTAMGGRSILLYTRDLMLARLQADYEADLKLRAAATLAAGGWTFASRIGQAGMQSLLLNDIPRVGKASASLQTIAISAILLVVQLSLALLLSTELALVAIGFVATGYLASTALNRKGVRAGRAIGESMESSAVSGFRLHAALKAALAQGTVPTFLDEYRTSLGGVTQVTTGFTRDYALVRQWAAFAGAIAAAVVLLVGIRVLGLPFPVLVASLILFSRMSAPAQMLQLMLFRLASDAPAFTAIEERLGKLEDAVTAEVQSVEPVDWRRLEVDGAGFEHMAGVGLRPVSLRLQRGDWVGIAGPSGTGKTTLVDLIAGLIAPQRGSIRVDGQPLEGTMADRWRAAIAYVGQEGTVFNDSVRGNLLAEGSAATDCQIWEALETVGLATRIRAFAGGLNEAVGDRGSQLSGGERQRLVLARALLRRPSLLILDEATSAIDPRAEEELLERIKQLSPRAAALVVAHRESTLSHCDSVIAIQHGEVTPPQPLTAAE